MARILYLYRDPPFAQFIADDRAILSSRHDVADIRLDATPRTAKRVLEEALRADLIYVWWGDLTGVAGVVLAALRKRPSVLITGGYDVADVPSIRYGLKHHPWRRHLPKLALKLATRVVANSENGRREALETAHFDRAKLFAIPHGFDAERITPGGVPKERRVLTVSIVSAAYVPYKGLETFVQAAAMFPEVPFVHAGPDIGDGAFERLRAIAPPNVRFLGFLDPDRLRHEMQRAGVYAQLSAHEGFGMAMAEAMLCGATPVVTRVGAVPEVAGEVPRYVRYGDAADAARGIREALDAPRSEAARERIVRCFPMSRRSTALLALVDDALASGVHP